MEYSLLENGIDSLKKAKTNIEGFEKYHKESSYHFLKDVIIFLNHGIEILLKYILSKQNESLIFTDINLYMEAKEKLKNESKGKKNPEGEYSLPFYLTIAKIVYGKLYAVNFW